MSTDCTTKTCSRCKQDKPLSAFSADRSKHDCLRSHCKACVASYRANYDATHQELITATKSIWRAEHKDRIAATNASWYANHREEQAAYRSSYRSNHREQIATRMSRWHKDNPNNKIAANQRRRARKIAVGGTHTATDIQRQGEVQKWLCWWCGEDCRDEYHVDHLIPLARGGHNGPGNIVIACPHCNLSKNNKTPDEFSRRLL